MWCRFFVDKGEPSENAYSWFDWESSGRAPPLRSVHRVLGARVEDRVERNVESDSRRPEVHIHRGCRALEKDTRSVWPAKSARRLRIARLAQWEHGFLPIRAKRSLLVLSSVLCVYAPERHLVCREVEDCRLWKLEPQIGVCDSTIDAHGDYFVVASQFLGVDGRSVGCLELLSGSRLQVRPNDAVGWIRLGVVAQVARVGIASVGREVPIFDTSSLMDTLV
ncbi:hypothetical protein FRC12_020100 [Ceratobasidium sp. 428]|nr:hypothetical protein FRC12_020100 [Ceratobasidium sp. 428]